MASEPRKHLTPNDLEYLDVGQAANICSVSDERFAKWIEKGLVPVIEHGSKRLVRAHDLIQHLIRHNIPIPERLLQGSSKKILFILMEETIPQSVTSEIIWTLYRLREQSPYIFDIVRDDTNIELKIITFNPDVIFLLRKDSTDQAREQAIARMANGTTPVHAFSIDHPIDLDLFLALLGDFAPDATIASASCLSASRSWTPTTRPPSRRSTASAHVWRPTSTTCRRCSTSRRSPSAAASASSRALPGPCARRWRRSSTGA